MMKNIIVIAYMLHYSKGSEFAVAWDYVMHMSKNNRLTVLYGSSKGHHTIGQTDEMEDYTSKHHFPNVTFIPVKPNKIPSVHSFSMNGIRKFYGEYKKWHYDVFQVVQELLKKEKYDIIHFLGPIGFQEPGFCYNLPVPYVWGPIGGLSRTPNRLLLVNDKKYGSHSGRNFILKSFFNRIRLYSSLRVRNAMREADVLACVITEYVDYLDKFLGKKRHCKLFYLPENCINELYDLNYRKFDAGIINLVFIGRLDSGKAPMMVLEAINKMGGGAEKIHLNILGDGPLLETIKKYVKKNDLESIVEVRGKIERSEVFDILRNSHLMVLPSLHDANTTVVWEAMSHAVPTMCLDHCGMHDTIKEGSGIKIPVTNYKDIIDTMARQLLLIVDNPHILRRMAEQLLEDRVAYTWEERERKFEEIYELAKEQFKNRKES